MRVKILDAISIVLVAIGLAIDAFSVATVTGFVLRTFSIKQALTLSIDRRTSRRSYLDLRRIENPDFTYPLIVNHCAPS